MEKPSHTVEASGVVKEDDNEQKMTSLTSVPPLRRRFESFFGPRRESSQRRFHQAFAHPDQPSTSSKNDLVCNVCQKKFTLKYNMLRHIRCHEKKEEEFTCEFCKKTFARASNLDHHKKFSCKSLQYKEFNEPSPSEEVKRHSLTEIETALKSRIKTYSTQPPEGDLQTVFNTLNEQLSDKIKESLRFYSAIKFNIFVECEFRNSDEEVSLKNLKTKNAIVYRTSNVSSLLNSAFEKLKAEKSECQMKRSGWSYQRVVRFELRINKYNPLRGATYIPLPREITKKKSTINVQNPDWYCFIYAIMSKHYDGDHPNRFTNYINNIELGSMYDWDCVEYPVKLDQIKKFEKVNNVSINVFGLDDQTKVYPLKVCDEEKENHYDLMFLKSESTSHYCLITDFNRLVSNQLTKHKERVLVCKRCFTHFDDQYDATAEEKLQNHNLLCSNHDAVRSTFPEYQHISFKNDHRSKKIRFVVYADFETMLVPLSTCEGDPDKSWTNAYQHHVPYSYAYILKDSENEHTALRHFRGVDAAKNFIQSLVCDVKRIDKVLFGNKKLKVPKLTAEQQNDFDSATECHICKKGEFTNNNPKVRNHCHVSGKYIGPAHSQCNLMYQDQNYLPVFVHNLSGYDAHIIVRELGYDKENINIIPNTEEKYVAFSKSVKVKHARNGSFEMRFLDSFRFMQSSLSQLADNLPRDEFHETKKAFPEKFDLVIKKGIFPYDFVTSLDKLEVTELPDKSKFYNKLNDEDITDEMYDHARNVWTQFNVKTLGEYSDIYVKTDVLILCDTFENFRKTCITTYELDPAYYYTVPGLSWDAMLKCTNVKIELIKDMDMVLMIENGIRGGITQCIKRYCTANNKYLETYDKMESSNYLYYVDANNLYGWAMSMPLPLENFEWADVTNLDIMSIPKDAAVGYILEVDLIYPKHLHDLHSDFPFCTETKIPPQGKHVKLLGTVEDKKKYVIHYIALQQALQHGLILQKVHRAIKFKQSAFIKPYIDLNTEKRRNAANAFEKDFFKLMSNSIFGKTMEGIRNRLDIRLVSDEKKVEKLIAKSTFLDRTIYSDNLVAIHLKKTKIVFDKPIQIGMSVLDISKTHMYNFHYNVMQNNFKDRINMCYQDTDSFIYEIKTDDLYEDVKNIASDYLDTSDYPSNHPLHSNKNKKVLGMFKDEVNGDIIEAFVGLRSKMYAIKRRNVVIKKIKGIKKSVIKSKINFSDYVKCIFDGEKTYSVNNLIRSKKHEIHTIATNKITLSADDDKRYILPDKINTLPYGHWRLEADEEPQAKRRKIE